MKKHASIIGFIILALFVSVSCNQQTSEADLQEELAEIREGHQEVINRIDEAMNIADVSEFKREIQNALDGLDNQIEDYHAEMDNANRRIDKETRDAIIEMKQKKTAIEFKLDLLEGRDNNNSSSGMTEGEGAERTDDATGPDWDSEGAERTDEVSRTDRIDDRTGTQRQGQMTSPERTGEWAGGPENLRATENDESRTETDDEVQQTERTDNERSGVWQDRDQNRETSGAERSGIRQDTTNTFGTSAAERSGIRQDTTQSYGTSGAERTLDMDSSEDDDMSSYYQELLNEIKNDLQELRSEIEEFTEKEL